MNSEELRTEFRSGPWIMNKALRGIGKNWAWFSWGGIWPYIGLSLNCSCLSGLFTLNGCRKPSCSPAYPPPTATYAGSHSSSSLKRTGINIDFHFHTLIYGTLLCLSQSNVPTCSGHIQLYWKAAGKSSFTRKLWRLNSDCKGKSILVLTSLSESKCSQSKAMVRGPRNEEIRHPVRVEGNRQWRWSELNHTRKWPCNPVKWVMAKFQSSKFGVSSKVKNIS